MEVMRIRHGQVAGGGGPCRDRAAERRAITPTDLRELRIVEPPLGTSRTRLYGVAALTGVGFTMSLFMGTLAFEGETLMAQVLLGVLSGLIAALVLKFVASPIPTTYSEVAAQILASTLATTTANVRVQQISVPHLR